MFKTPIQYLPETKQLNKQCQNDLQLSVIYKDLLKDESSSIVRKSWINDYTTNVDFLKDTQALLNTDVKNMPTKYPFKKIEETLKELRDNPSFKEKYEYITVEFFEKLNRNEIMLQAISMYTLSSPIISLLMPVIMMFIPFFALRVVGKPVTMGNYIEQLKKVFSMMPIGKLFQMGEASWDQRGFIMFSVILYFVQMYQNSLTCYKFYRHSQEMAKTIHDFGYYCNSTAYSMETYKTLTDKLPTYDGFCSSLQSVITQLRKMGQNFITISSSPFRDMGPRMKIFYDLYADDDYKRMFDYTFAYHEYSNNMLSLMDIDEIHQCSFSSSKTSLKNSYYSLLRHCDPTKNSYSLKKNGILSGPNASGKTTLLKSTMINSILCQQFGGGFFDNASILPVDYYHCYINIPDTCDRDSLFQAEARRCKEILDNIHANPNATHFCVFDELFSGTNPYEAVGSAFGYLTYLHKYKNVKYLLTTHYLDLCKEFTKTKYVSNYTLDKPYCLEKGISNIKGGIKMLDELEFPSEIIKTAQKMVS